MTEEKVKIRIVQDDCSDNLWDEILADENCGTFVAWHNRKNLGHINGQKGRDVASEKIEQSVLFIPIYIYEHGGFMLSLKPFSDPFDSGQVGVWCFTEKQLIDLYDSSDAIAKQKARDIVEGQIKVMNDLSEGNVWGYEILDFDGDVCDSCFGFIGDQAVEMMKEYIPDNRHLELESAWENRF